MMQSPGIASSPSSSATLPSQVPEEEGFFRMAKGFLSKVAYDQGFLFRVARSTAVGAGFNGAFYCVLRASKKYSLPPVQSFLLLGALSNGLIVVATEVYVLGVRLLGDFQQNEKAIQAGQATVGNRLRQLSWKVIHRVDGVVNKIDEFVSDKLGIRSARELNLHYEIRKVRVPGESNMVDTVRLVHNHSDSWNPRRDRELKILEIIRFAFWGSMARTALEKSAVYLSNRMIKEIGYGEVPRMEMGLGAMFGNNNVYKAFAFNFCLNLVQRCNQIYAENQENIA